MKSSSSCCSCFPDQINSKRRLHTRADLKPGTAEVLYNNLRLDRFQVIYPSTREPDPNRDNSLSLSLAHAADCLPVAASSTYLTVASDVPNTSAEPSM